MYIAHIRESDAVCQSVKEHLIGVKCLAERIGSKLSIEKICGLTGMLHDLGKYSDEFQEYLLEAVQNPDSPPKRGSVDHSTAGGALLYQMYHTKNVGKYTSLLAEIVGNAIISHHSPSLNDYVDERAETPYLKRVRDKVQDLRDYEQAVRRFYGEVMSEAELYSYAGQAAVELEQYLSVPSLQNLQTRIMFLSKFVFSALIDADRTDTRRFEENSTKEETETEQSREELFTSYYGKLMTRLDSLRDLDTVGSPINHLRRAMSDRCEQFAERPSGIYLLSIPTGGGKTLASLRYGLRHAIRHGKKRIVYVVPFTTIIEQNAEEVRRLLEDEENILEHHSNVVVGDDDEDEGQDGVASLGQKLKLAKDNWDSPIIFTTMVQFLSVFYAKGSRNVRRLHNLSEAVIIFDEVQKVPVPCVSLFNQALNFLSGFARSSLILCTATQPALDFVERKLEIPKDAEIVENLDQVTEAFKRVEMIDRASGEKFNTYKLAVFIEDRKSEARSVLVVLNTKSAVKRLYRRLEGTDGALFHLSTSMCAAHRQAILAEIREHLERGDDIVCISTQLIEAGVDVSFDCVIRSLAGLDSIAQAAGRCNRHGKNDIQNVYVIDHEEERLEHLKEIRAGKTISAKILKDLERFPEQFGGNLLSNQAMTYYFREFYDEFSVDLDYPVKNRSFSILNLLMAGDRDNSLLQAYKSRTGHMPPISIRNSYRTAAEYFEVIDNRTTSAIAPYGEGKELIAALNGAGTIEELSKVLRKAQKYTVNLFGPDRDRLSKNGGLIPLLNGQIFALAEGAYHDEYGVDLENDSGFGEVIF